MANFKTRDVVTNTTTHTIWWLGAEWVDDERGYAAFKGGALTGICLFNDPSDGSWTVGETCPFGLLEEYTDVDILGHDYDYDQACAIATLTGIEGFVKGVNNGAA